LHGVRFADDGQNARQIPRRSDAQGFSQYAYSPEPGEPPLHFGDLLVFSAVRRFPQRVKCATLAWRALEQALSASPGQAVTTEDSEL
jgi:NifU-like protein involved in Fe-S cluster formation